MPAFTHFPWPKSYLYSMRSFARFLLKLFGWQVVNGVPPNLKKYVVAVAPHTSWKDFVLGLLVRAEMGRNIYYLAKKELFDNPIGFIFWWTGGRPVDRKIKTGLVDQVIQLFNDHEEFAIAIAPEGTRKKVQNFRTGFYHIARGAKIPIIPCLLDYHKKEVRFLSPFYPTDDIEADLDLLWGFFQNVKGAIAERGISDTRDQ